MSMWNSPQKELSKEERMAVVKNGFTTAQKDEENRLFIILLKSVNYEFNSSFTDCEDEDNDIRFDAEALIDVGQRDMFIKVSNIINNDEENDIDIKNSKVLMEGLPLTVDIPLMNFIERCNQKYPDLYVDISGYYLDSEEEKNPTQATGMGTAGTII